MVGSINTPPPPFYHGGGVTSLVRRGSNVSQIENFNFHIIYIFNRWKRGYARLVQQADTGSDSIQAFGVDAKIQMGENTEMLQEAKKLQALRGTKPSYFNDVAQEIIKSRRQQGLTGRKDLLELMMTATDETTVEGVSKLTDEEVVAQAVIFVLAGYETSSNMLSFTTCTTWLWTQMFKTSLGQRSMKP